MPRKTKIAIGLSILVALIAGAAIGQADPSTTTAQATTVTSTVTKTVTADPTLDQRKAARAKLRELRAGSKDARSDASSAERREREAKAELRDLKAELSTTADQVAMSSFEGDGTYVVDEDILPGTYRAEASPGCYWETSRGSGTGSIDSIIDNDNDNADGPVVIQVTSEVYEVKVSGCATFERAG